MICPFLGVANNKKYIFGLQHFDSDVAHAMTTVQSLH